MNSVHHGSTASLPAIMEPSQLSPVDFVGFSFIDAMESKREMHEKIDPEQIKPSKRFKFSESMNPGHHGTPLSSASNMEPSQPSPINSAGLSPPMDAKESIKEMYEKIDPDEQINPLVSFVETRIHKMNTPAEAGSSSSKSWLGDVRDNTKLAAKTIYTVSKEAEKLSKSDPVEAMGSLTLKIVKGVGELRWVFIGLSLAASGVDSYRRVRSMENECSQLLLKILELAKNVKQYSEQMLERGKTSRFWSAMTAAAQLEKTNQQLRDSLSVFSLQPLLDEGDKDVFLSHSGKQKNFFWQLQGTCFMLL